MDHSDVTVGCLRHVSSLRFRVYFSRVCCLVPFLLGKSGVDVETGDWADGERNPFTNGSIT
jgi:hypothetical protein